MAKSPLLVRLGDGGDLREPLLPSLRQRRHGLRRADHAQPVVLLRYVSCEQRRSQAVPEWILVSNTPELGPSHSSVPFPCINPPFHFLAAIPFLVSILQPPEVLLGRI